MYLDSAIIVKLVIHEEDSFFYVQKLQAKTDARTSAVALTECYAALCRKEREKAITRKERQMAWNKIEGFIQNGGIELVTLTENILANANRIIEECHPTMLIRSLDAIHLASCEHTAAWPLYTNDKRMRDAAEHLKIPLGPRHPSRL